MKLFLLSIAIIFASGVETFGQEFTKDDGNLDLPFDSVDVQILKRANNILLSEYTPY